MKRIIALLLVLLMAVSASAMKPFVVDKAGLFSKEDVASLEEEFDKVYEDYGFTVAVVTRNTLEEKTGAAVAAEIYSSSKYSNDGALLLLCPKEAQWYIYTSGLCTQEVPDNELAAIGEAMLADLQEDNYLSAVRTFADRVVPPVRETVETQRANAEDRQTAMSWLVVLGLVAGLAAGILVVALLTIRKPAGKKQEEDQPEAGQQEQNPEI